MSEPILIVMRLAEMLRVHPHQIEAMCHGCSHPVGIYPSGQEVIAKYPDIKIICFHCQPDLVAGAMLAPGAGPREARQSVPGPAAKRQ